MKAVTIVGGGLAGLTLGIALRQRGVPATVWESGHYPRHRVCGEFISGRGLAVLERLGLAACLDRAGAFKASTARFIAGRHRSPVRRLPYAATCLSRYFLDALLAEQFQQWGGELRTGTRWESGAGEGVVRASGRRVQASVQGWRWFGMKAHVRHLAGPGLSADLEMHCGSDGYVGVNRIDRGEVNVCGLFRARCGASPGKSKWASLQGKPGTLLRERLAGAEFDHESFCSVGGLFLNPRRATGQQDCCVGDALTMIPPVTGNGMSMAFESAEIAAGPLAVYSRGGSGWEEARGVIAVACDSAFAQRLAWARRLQWLMFSPLLRGPAGNFLFCSEWLWRMLFAKTR